MTRRNQSTDSFEGAADRWFKGNLHMHSHWSDGDVWPEIAALWYRDRGYDFVCLTDHDTLPQGERWRAVDDTEGGRVAYEQLKQRCPGSIDEREVDGRLEVRLATFDELTERVAQPGEFVVIQGEEITDWLLGYDENADKPETSHVHVNAINSRELIPTMGGRSVYAVMQNNVNAVLAQAARTRGGRMLAVVNHPNLYTYPVRAEDLMRVSGAALFEIYNGHPGSNNAGDNLHASMDRVWDVVLSWRLSKLGMPLVYGIATDDTHDYHGVWNRGGEPGRGWIRVNSAELTTEALLTAVEAGQFYSSTGVEFTTLVTSPDGIDLRVDAKPGESYTVEFIGTRAGFDPIATPVMGADGQTLRATRRYSADIGAVLARAEGTEASFRFRGDELYVRARVSASTPHPNPASPGDQVRAWTQPISGPGNGFRAS